MNILKSITARIDKLFGLDVVQPVDGVGHIYMQVNNAEGKRVVTGSRTSMDPHGDFRVMTMALELSQAAARGVFFKPHRLGSVVVTPFIEGFGTGEPSTDEQMHMLHLAYWPTWDWSVFKKETERFEGWYVTNAFDYEREPLGSRECMIARRSWMARVAIYRGIDQ